MARIVLATGGTGGHIFPALAVAEAILECDPDSSLLFLGSVHGPEHRLVKNAGLDFRGLNVRGFMGRGSKKILASLEMSVALVHALKVLVKFRPDVVAGFGGYASFAPMLAARMLGIRTVIHEQNAVAGSCNRIIGKFAGRICLSIKHTAGFLGAKCIHTGNPVRQAMNIVGKRRLSAPHEQRRLLVLGGSQGAHTLNEFICSVLPVMRSANIEIRHQTGSADHSRVCMAYEEAGYSCDCVAPFFDDMASQYEWADLALCRSGASTIGELCATGLPALLVPFPFAIHDHQTANARMLAQAGAARLIRESDLHSSGWDAMSALLFQADDEWRTMSLRALNNSMPGAASAVANVILGTARLRHEIARIISI